MMVRSVVCLCVLSGTSAAQQAAPAPGTATEPSEQTSTVEPTEAAPVAESDSLTLPGVQLHGFVSQGAFISSANDYIGESSRGTLHLTEAGLNASTSLTDRLRTGIQVFARDVGKFQQPSPRLDWAFLDYRYKRALGLRAGVIRLPFGLYNEYVDIDAARVPILLPQGVYPVRNRDALLALRGFSLYGEHTLSASSILEYQAWFGTLSVPATALNLSGASLDRVDTKYITGAQAFWHPIEGLRIGGTYVRASIDFHLVLGAETVAGLIMAGSVPPEYGGEIVVSSRPLTMVIGSVEYTRDRWVIAAEYSREIDRQRTNLPAAIPTIEEDSEAAYVLTTYQATESLQVGGYVSVTHLDSDDRLGRAGTAAMIYPERFYAFQRDATATLRWDVTPNWLWKLEAHGIDGVGDLSLEDNPDPVRYWAVLLVRTTVSF